jgi:hypothetical protein
VDLTRAAEKYQARSGATSDEVLVLAVCSEITARALAARLRDEADDLPTSFLAVRVVSPILSPDRSRAVALKFW